MPKKKSSGRGSAWEVGEVGFVIALRQSGHAPKAIARKLEKHGSMRTAKAIHLMLTKLRTGKRASPALLRSAQQLEVKVGNGLKAAPKRRKLGMHWQAALKTELSAAQVPLKRKKRKAAVKVAKPKTAVEAQARMDAAKEVIKNAGTLPKKKIVRKAVKISQLTQTAFSFDVAQRLGDAVASHLNGSPPVAADIKALARFLKSEGCYQIIDVGACKVQLHKNGIQAHVTFRI